MAAILTFVFEGDVGVSLACRCRVHCTGESSHVRMRAYAHLYLCARICMHPGTGMVQVHMCVTGCWRLIMVAILAFGLQVPCALVLVYPHVYGCVHTCTRTHVHAFAYT